MWSVSEAVTADMYGRRRSGRHGMHGRRRDVSALPDVSALADVSALTVVSALTDSVMIGLRVSALTDSSVSPH